MKIPFIKNIDLKDKRVFLRADLNVPTQNKKILQDFKLKAILPTIKYILQNGGKVILATHIARPKTFNPNLSTQILIPWFQKNGFKIKFISDLQEAESLSSQDFDQILLLENMRFFDGEKGNQQEREKFATQLHKLADIYVNDAFALIHRDDTSTSLLPQKFDCAYRGFGILMQKEIESLNKLKQDIQQPFVLIVGGNKIKDKTKLLENFLNMQPTSRPQSILIGGAVANTFLKAQGIEIGKSIFDKQFLDFAKNLLQDAQSKNIKIELPVDTLVVKNIGDVDVKTVDIKNIPNDYDRVDIGQQTIKNFEQIIKSAKIIFINGTIGIYTNKNYQNGSKKILEAIANSNAYTVAGGGDCVAAIHLFELQDKFDFLSTGGGATLTYLSSKNPMRELEALKVMMC